MLRPLRQRSDLYREKPLATAWTIEGVKEALAAKKISARELLADFYRRIEARNPELNAYLALTPERARRQAERIDALVAAGGPLPPLAGVPMAIKDVISTRGTKTTCGSKILENYIPPYDAPAVERLEAAGAVLLGKTNCDEFAMGSSNENSAYVPVKTPLAPDRRRSFHSSCPWRIRRNWSCQGEPRRRLRAVRQRWHRTGECNFRESSSRRRSEEHTSELQSRLHLVCRLLLEKKNQA